MSLLLAVPDVDARYAAIVARDATRDGAFWYGVSTTHVFCRPSCSAKTPNVDHVEYFHDPGQALRAGFRPCQRCRPLGDGGEDALAETTVRTPIGPMVAIANAHGLALLEFSNRPMLRTQRERVRRLFNAESRRGEVAVFEQLRDELAAYFAGRLRRFTVPLLPLGTPFQRAMWRELVRVRYGTTTTYDALAVTLGKPHAPRAVGRANGDNRIAILIPCHRVIGSDGDLTGYGGGLWRKRALLELERRA
jgi:AraC family transcriptional regulator of adaptative response/methylated-DNA-[protein]-cysteine methyltransferase